MIPFPHHYIRFVPSACVQFQGTAELVPSEDPEAQASMKTKRILKMGLDRLEQPDMQENTVFLKIKPRPKIFCHGLGIGMMELRKHQEIGHYSVLIPPDRR